ncbi:MAG TPA: ribosome maturation factor RimM [Bacilli bacterium]
MYLVGKIIGTHGIKGEVKVKADTSFDRFKPGNTLYLKKNNEFQEIIINSHRRHKNYDLITFNNLNNINQVLEFIDCELYTPHQDKLEDNEYYYEDLIGKLVYDTNNNYLGKVIDIRELPHGINLEIKNGRTFYVPFVSEFIIEVTNDKIIINVIEGLI